MSKNKKIEALPDSNSESSTALEKMSEPEIDALLTANGIDPKKSILTIDAAFEKAHLLHRKYRATVESVDTKLVKKA